MGVGVLGELLYIYKIDLNIIILVFIMYPCT